MGLPAWLVRRAGEGPARPGPAVLRRCRGVAGGGATAGMNGFLEEVGQKLADRWAALVAVPGLLYLAAITAAAVLGQEHALSYPDLGPGLAPSAMSPQATRSGPLPQPRQRECR